MSASWLNEAVFYEIYPQSFYDSNGDGIGDIPGMTAKLDYIRSLGCNALWINPCYDSPFRDGGYDVRDYQKVAPRYGTNEDLLEFFRQAHEKGFHVLLDLVPCHTSEEHPWFLDSAKARPGVYKDRYIWTDHWGKHPGGLPFVGGDRERNGCYVISYFKCQPALNYGFANPTEDWQDAADSPNALATREALWEIMDFWLSRGCDGFRVDMASELVKGDGEDRACARAIYKDLKGRMAKKYPQAALVSEWSTPEWSLECGFDMDFYLDWPRMGTHYLLRNYEGLGESGPLRPDRSYFQVDSGVSPMPFLEEYLPRYEISRKNGLWCFLTCNHDTTRLRFNLSPEEMKIAYGFIFTMPGAPYLYYGDEIGMRYLNLPSKEGGYTRTGSRTPMQWNKGKNLGFSTAEESRLYLPVDPAADAPAVEEQEADPHSLLHHVRALTALRRQYPQFGAYEPFEVYFAREDSRILAYRRGSLICAVNPGRVSLSLELDGDYRVVFSCGEAQVENRHLLFRGFVVLEPVCGE